VPKGFEKFGRAATSKKEGGVKEGVNKTVKPEEKNDPPKEAQPKTEPKAKEQSHKKEEENRKKESE
jgi:hypothetical protein